MLILNLCSTDRSLAEQLGVKDDETLRKFDKVRESILMLHSDGYISDSQMKECFKGLNEQLSEHRKKIKMDMVNKEKFLQDIKEISKNKQKEIDSIFKLEDFNFYKFIELVKERVADGTISNRSNIYIKVNREFASDESNLERVVDYINQIAGDKVAKIDKYDKVRLGRLIYSYYLVINVQKLRAMSM